jgi:renalase
MRRLAHGKACGLRLSAFLSKVGTLKKALRRRVKGFVVANLAIIGAGIAGLTLGRHAQAAGLSCVIFDKGRGVGGRAATRRTEYGPFDHGLQLLDPRQMGNRLLMALADLQPHCVSVAGLEFWRVPQGASSLAKVLAADLDVQLTTQISKVYACPAGWRLVDHMGEDHGPYHWVVFALPPAQIQKLWPKSVVVPEALEKAKMAPCWSMMTALKTPLVAANGVYQALGFDWVASWDQGTSWVAQASAALSNDMLEAEAENAAQQLWEKFAQGFGLEDSAAMMCQAHRWRYARTHVPAGVPYVLDGNSRLAACGDWCLGPNAADAFESGASLAQTLLAVAQELAPQAAYTAPGSLGYRAHA